MVSNHQTQTGSQHTAEIVDIAEYAKHKLKIPESGVIYFFEIEGQKYKVPKAKNTGKELLELAGKTPINSYYLLQMFSDGTKKEIKPDDVVDLSTFGVEKFNVICKTNTDGLYGGKRDFPLPPADEKYLNTLGLRWETLASHNQKRLVIYDWPLIDGYNVKHVTLTLVITQGYPEVQIDMAFFAPFLTRQDGKSINATTPVSVGGETLQQWSRHRTASNPWRSGIDDVSTHLSFVNHFISEELKRG